VPHKRRLAEVHRESNDFSALLNKEFKPKSDRAKAEVENAVQTLAEYVLKDAAVVSDDALNSIQSDYCPNR